MSKKLVMVITGTRTGIGKGLVKFYSKKGFHIIGCSREEVDYNLDNYKHFCLDVSDESSVKTFFSNIRKTYGRLDVLINNAGIATKNYLLLTSLSEVKKTINTNILGSILFCRESVKLMKLNNFGRIINISSIHVPLASKGTSIYGASKAAIEQFSRVISKEVFQYGINVNTIALSIVKNTGMENSLNDQMKSKILLKTISKSLLNMDDITNPIDFLISKKSKMITNQLLTIGGL